MNPGHMRHKNQNKLTTMDHNNRILIHSSNRSDKIVSIMPSIKIIPITWISLDSDIRFSRVGIDEHDGRFGGSCGCDGGVDVVGCGGDDSGSVGGCAGADSGEGVDEIGKFGGS